jgi:GNAT superfamily N-acetyltransferase
MTVRVVPVTDAKGAVTDEALLRSAEAVHLQLRPQLAGRYLERLREVFASGAEMAVAVVDGRVAGITVFRVIEKTHSGRELYCDDLVTDEGRRSTGVGHALMQYMERTCRERKCDTFALDSGCQRQQAHKFYYREGMTILAFHFAKKPSA